MNITHYTLRYTTHGKDELDCRSTFKTKKELLNELSTNKDLINICVFVNFDDRQYLRIAGPTAILIDIFNKLY